MYDIDIVYAAWQQAADANAHAAQQLEAWLS